MLYPAVGTRVVLPMRGRGCKRGPLEFILGAKVLQHNYRNFYDNVKIKAGGHNYEPDMVMVDADHGIFIEIEVDEPYTWGTKSPTHCKGSRDKLRNKHITEAGWIVVRFSEKQIFSQPMSCLKKCAR